MACAHVERALALPRGGALERRRLGHVAVRLHPEELPPRVQPDVHGVDGEREVGQDGEQVHVREGLLRVDVREGRADGAAALHALLHHHRRERLRLCTRGLEHKD